MNTHKYNDGLCPGGRRPRLYLAKGGEVRKFGGQNIPDYCAVTTAQYQKNGKWSNTSYTLALAPGVRALEFLSPLHGTWGDDMASWGAVAEHLSLPVDVAQAIVRVEYPETGERLDQLEVFAIACLGASTMNTATDITADLRRRASVIADALKTAFGGRSQVSTKNIGEAVAGQINNNGLTVHGTLEEVCVAVVDAFDEGHDDDDTPVDEVVGACRASLDALGVSYRNLPYRVPLGATE